MTHPESEILVSICCVCYNQEKFIEQTLNGFLIQKTDFEIEILVHDDASTDGTQEVVRNYAAKDKRIVPILRTSNLKSAGVPVFPVVYKMSRGKYIAICEGDDYWIDPMKLQKQVDFLESNPDVILCAHQVNILRHDKLNPDTFLPGAYDLEHIVSEGRIGQTPSYVFQNVFKFEWGKSALEHFLSSGVLSGDRSLQLLLCSRGRIVLLEGYMAVYRKHMSGIMNTKAFQSNHNLGIYRLLRQFDRFTDYEFRRITRPARLKWLHLVLTREVNLTNKLSACYFAFSEGILTGFLYILSLPYHLVRALIYRWFRID